MQSANYFPVTLGQTIFVTNIFLRLGSLSLTHNHVFPQGCIECTLIFQSLLLQNQKLKSRNNSISHIFKKKILNRNTNEIYISLFQRLIVVEEWLRLYCGKGVTEIILWWKSDRLYCGRGVTEIILWSRGDWDYIVVEEWLRLYWRRLRWQTINMHNRTWGIRTEVDRHTGRLRSF